MSLVRKAVLGAGLLILLGQTQSNSSDVLPIAGSTKAQAIHRLLHSYHVEGQFDGSALVVSAGEVIYAGGKGEANREWHQRNGPETRFYIASCTKPFTATLILQLAEEGQIDLDAAVSNYLPGLNPTLANQFSARQLLRHTSGLVRDWSEFAESPGSKDAEDCSYECVIDVLGTTHLVSVPGEQFAYSNAGYTLLGAIIEQVTGQSYLQVLRQRILQPLEMNQTGAWRGAPVIENRASSYDPRLLCQYLNVEPDHSFSALGAGGLYSTVGDLYRFDQGLLGTFLLTEETKTEMFSAGPGGYGLGWYITPFEIESEPHVLIRHSGVGAGYGSVTWRFPQDQHFIALLQNNSAVPMALANDILNILFESTDGMKPPVKAWGRHLICTLLDDGVDVALSQYDDMPQNEFRPRQTGARQATGSPNSSARDSDSAWASRTPDGHPEWLILDYGEPFRPTHIEVFENYNPGAVTRISAFNASGSEIDISLSDQYRSTSENNVSTLVVPMEVAFDTARLKLYLDSPAVPGWNEIDAVGLVDQAGDTRWAKEARASSTGADGSPHTSLTRVPNSGDLNKLGHQYLELGQVDEALLVFRFATRAHPESIVAHRSLARVHHVLGNSETASGLERRARQLETTDQERVRKRLADSE